MSLNGYAWVEGNAVNRTDPSGMWGVADTALLNAWAGCGSDFPEGDVSGRLYKRRGFVAGQNITVADPDGGGGGAVPTSVMIAMAAAAGGGVLLGLLAAMQAAGQIVQLPWLFLAQMASAALSADRSFGSPQTYLLEPTIQPVPGPSLRATATPAPGFSILPPQAYGTVPPILPAPVPTVQGGFGLLTPGGPDIYISSVYRQRYMDYRLERELAPLPDGYEVHHRVPQAYRNQPGFSGFGFDEIPNLRGVPGWQAVLRGTYNADIHSQITGEWRRWQRSHPNATLAEAQQFATDIDNRYSQHYWESNDPPSDEGS